MEGLTYIPLILCTFILNFTFSNRTPPEKEKNILEENDISCDPKRPNIFVDRNNLLGKMQPAMRVHQHSQFTYGSGPNGPAHWPKLFKECAGKHQSPIDIALSSLKNVHMQKLTWDSAYSQMPEMITVANNGRTVVVKPKFPTGKQASIQGGPLNSLYVLDHIHFHWGSSDHKGSEHTINGKSFPMEMHAVHLKEHMTLEQAAKLSDGIAVVGYLFEVDEMCHRAIKNIQEDFELMEIDLGTAQPLRNMFAMSELAEPFCDGYVTYKGSLTTPPCSEAVIWIVSPYTVDITCHRAIQYIEQVFELITVDVGLDVPLLNIFPIKDLAEQFGSGYVTYNGSLTTPPCTEQVVWILSPYYIGVTITQLRKFRRLYASSKGLVNNFRPLQPLNNRTVDEMCHRAIKNIQEDFELMEIDLGTAQPLRNMFAMSELAEPFCDAYVTYKGSLTTPPYSEAVIWIVSPYTVGLTKNQLHKFRELYESSKELINGGHFEQLL